MQTLKEVIAGLARARGWTMKYFIIEKLHLTPNGYYRMLKSNSVKVSTLIAIAEALEVKLHILLDENVIPLNEMSLKQTLNVKEQILEMEEMNRKITMSDEVEFLKQQNKELLDLLKAVVMVKIKNIE